MAEIVVLEALPVAAVDEHRVRPAMILLGAEDVGLVAGVRPIGKTQFATRGGAEMRRVGLPGGEDRRVFGHPGAIAVFGFEIHRRRQCQSRGRFVESAIELDARHIFGKRSLKYHRKKENDDEAEDSTMAPALLRIAAAAVIALVAPVIATLMVAAPATAGAKVGVSINFGSFYDRLAPYGDWLDYQGHTVFVPTRRAAHWRPYQQGHWAYTDRYGWMWVSAEPFGWATYHYGRWGFSPDIGWYWVPGYRWAPAWVSWRRSDNYVGWSPLPVGYPDDGGVNVTIAPVPDFYWQVVPSRSFLSVNLAGVIIRDRHRADPFFRHARPVGHVRIVNDVVVNNVIGVSVVERWTHKKVRAYRVREGRKPGMRARRQGGFIDVYAPRVHKGGKHKPKRLRSFNEVKAWHKKTRRQDAGCGSRTTTRPRSSSSRTAQGQEEAAAAETGTADKAKKQQRQDHKAKKQQRQDHKAKKQQQQDHKAKKKQQQDHKAKKKQRQDHKAKKKQQQDHKAKKKQQRTKDQQSDRRPRSSSSRTTRPRRSSSRNTRPRKSSSRATRPRRSSSRTTRPRKSSGRTTRPESRKRRRNSRTAAGAVIDRLSRLSCGWLDQTASERRQPKAEKQKENSSWSMMCEMWKPRFGVML